MELEIGGGGRGIGRRKEEDWKSFDGIRLKVASKGKNGQHSLVKRKKGKEYQFLAYTKWKNWGMITIAFSPSAFTRKHSNTHSQVHSLTETNLYGTELHFHVIYCGSEVKAT